MIESPFAKSWSLDAHITFLNHGSFGACPHEVVALQDEIRAKMEREPVSFFVRTLEPLLDESRAALGELVHANPDDIAFVSNATAGVNTVVRSLVFEPGDEILTTDHAYNACKNALLYVAERHRAKVVVAKVPFPISSPEEITEAVVARVTPKTKLALIDHVTSPTALIFPVAEITRALQARGVAVLIDGAHAPGMVALDFEALAPDYYTGNCHKWLCAPKGAAFLYARRDRQKGLRPLSISHGANSSRTDRTRFRLEFDWAGTDDPSAFLSVKAAIDFLSRQMPGGLAAVRTHNHALAVKARTILCETLDVKPPCPEMMLGSMATVPIADGNGAPPIGPVGLDALQARLHDEFGIEVPVFAWPAPPRRLLRVSAQLYNHEGQYRKLAETLRRIPS